jgi:3-methyl-2-oxobutanoate hydroxymethyltransferase
MPEKMTAPGIRALKAKQQKAVCVTAYDYPSGLIADAAGVDMVLVGDSVGNVVLGYETTLPVNLEDIVYHTRAVSRAVKRALVIADLPFGSYQSSPAQAVDSAVALVKAGASAVKPEGARLETVDAILAAGIPVMGHVGLTPQSVHQFGGFKVQGKGGAGDAVLKAAGALDKLGVFAIVLELIPIDLAKRISESVSCPTIGIGAGPYCDGQVQVFHDILGLGTQYFKHTKQYANGYEIFVNGISTYAEEVRADCFPLSEHGFEDHSKRS